MVGASSTGLSASLSARSARAYLARGWMVARLRSRLPRSAGQPFGVRDQHALALQANPAAVGEVGQRLVHGLAWGANQRSDLLLRQVVSHPHRATLLGTETLSELQ